MKGSHVAYPFVATGEDSVAIGTFAGLRILRLLKKFDVTVLEVVFISSLCFKVPPATVYLTEDIGFGRDFSSLRT